MKNVISIIKFGIIAILVIFYTIPCLAQQILSCGDDFGKYQCNEVWYITNPSTGVKYRCVCNCSGNGPECAPVNSSSSGTSSSSGSSSGYSTQTQMAQALLQPVVDNFFKWLFSSPEPTQKKTQSYEAPQRTAEEIRLAEEKYKKEREEYNAKVLAQITNAQSTYKEMMAAQSQGKKEETVNDFKNRFAIAEATKNVKKLNCAAYTSLQAAEIKIKEFSNFEDLDGPAEKARTTADFTTTNTTECPEVKINIPEVSAAQPVSFQEGLYNYIVNKSDSITKTLDTLKAKKTKNDLLIDEKKTKVKELTIVVEKQKKEANPEGINNQTPDNKLADEALKELEAATKELETAEQNENKMKEEIELKEKNIQTLEKMRSTYDKPKPEVTPVKPVNK